MGIPLKPFINPLAGRPLHFTPKQLAEKFEEYVKWSEENVIEIGERQKGIASGGYVDKTTTNYKQRLISVHGFLVFIGKSKRWWTELSDGKQGDKFSTLKDSITSYCEDYQKEMAAAGIFNANIISRLLGLADKKELTGESINIIVNSPEEKEKLESMKDMQI
ncbi:MAG: hypothetical protein IIU76_00950 [Bacteroidales bacterium]|nr:hypothetical protein [Bacteroidales bacterium]